MAESDTSGESVPESSVGELFGTSSPKRSARFTTAPSLPTFFHCGKTAEIAEKKPILYALVGAGLLLAFVAIIFLSVAVGSLKNKEPYPNLCTTSGCLWEASNLLENMNFSADPCVDFFSYVCGNFPKNHPLPDLWTDITVPLMISQENDRKLKDSLENPVKDFSDTSAEKKLKIFFQSCKDEFQRTKMGGKPLLDYIYSLGGWQAIYGSFDKNSWTKSRINYAMQSMVRLGIPVFFEINVRADVAPIGGTAKTNKIYLDVPTLGLGYANAYIDIDEKTMDAYRNYIQGFIKLLWKDAGIHLSPENAAKLLQNVTDEIIFVETLIANLTSNTRPIWRSDDVHKPMNYLDQTFPGIIQWSDLLKNYFEGANLQPTTVINLSEPDYIAGVADLINTLTVSQINSYMMWQVAQKFYSTLGWEYIFLGRVWAMIKYDGFVTFVGTYNWCLIEIQRNLQQLLSSLFVQDHFVDTSGQQVNTIFGYVQQETLRRIETYAWMDEETKSEAKLKISEIRDMIGYPSWLLDNAKLNTFYSQLKIQKDAHFTNLMSVLSFQAHLATTKIIKETIDLTEWPAAIYDAYLSYGPNENRLFFPAGMLQHPIYNYKVPMVINFATMGRYVAEQLVTALFYRCSDHTGAHSCWWSADSAKKFNKAYECNMKPYANLTYCTADQYFVHERCYKLQYPDYDFAVANMKGVGAVNLVYSAYKSYVADHGPESVMAGLQADSIDQTFFLGYAQTFCYNRVKIWTYLYYRFYGDVIPEIAFDKVLSQFPSFGDAFTCDQDSPMTGTKQCDGF